MVFSAVCLWTSTAAYLFSLCFSRVVGCCFVCLACGEREGGTVCVLRRFLCCFLPGVFSVDLFWCNKSVPIEKGAVQWGLSREAGYLVPSGCVDVVGVPRVILDVHVFVFRTCFAR